MPRAHILFDLDGTLVDSFDGVEASLRHALTACGIAAPHQIGRQVLGPPLREILTRWIPAEDTEALQRAMTAFKLHYDTVGLRMTRPFDGVSAMLEGLVSAGSRASIVTNKRGAPARTIIELLGWSRLFVGVHSLDATHPPAASKAEVLGRVLRELELLPEETVYIGDRLDDGDAAETHAIPFALAMWGLDDDPSSQARSHWKVLRAPCDVLTLCG